MADDLDRLVDSIDSEGPSPEFVAALRARIVALTEGGTVAAVAEPVPDELTRSADHDDDRDPDDDHDHDDLDDPDDAVVRLRPARRGDDPGSRWVPFVAVAAAVVLLLGLLVVNRDDGQVEHIDQPTVPSGVPITAAVPPPSFATGATRFDDQFELLDPGTYRIDAVGTPFSLTLNEEQEATVDHAAFIVADPDIRTTDDSVITFMRLTALSDPASPIVSPADATTTWPADDFDGWLDNVSGEIVVSNRAETRLGGLSATRADLELGEVDCVAGPDWCGWFATNHLVWDQELRVGAQYRVWVVDQGEHDPLAVIAAIDRPEDRDWFERADEILSTIAFGQVGPNPIGAAGAGPVDLDTLGGISLDLPAGSFALQGSDGVDRVHLTEWPGGTSFVTGLLDRAGEPFEASDDLLAAMRSGGVALNEMAPTSVGGVDARVFEFDAASPWIVLRPATDPDRTWSIQRRGRLWLVEHPERGLLVISSGAYENLDIVTPLAVEQGAALVESLEFVEPD